MAVDHSINFRSSTIAINESSIDVKSYLSKVNFNRLFEDADSLIIIAIVDYSSKFDHFNY